MEVDFTNKTKKERELKKKYSKKEGYTFDELEDNVKQLIKNNTSEFDEWWIGDLRWIYCTICNKYYLSNYCTIYQNTKGICKYCDKK